MYRSVLFALILLIMPRVLFAGAPFVLFDQSHGELFSPMSSGAMDYSKFAALFEKEGFAMKVQSKSFNAHDLKDASAFIISGSFHSFKQPEIKALQDYVAGGGKLILLIHVAPLIADVCHAFNLDVSNAIIHEQDPMRMIDASEENIYLTDFVSHPLFYGVKKVGVYGVWGMLAEDKSSVVLAQTSSVAYADLNKSGKREAQDPVQAFGIVTLTNSGKGKVLAIGDDAVLCNRFINTADNRKFAANIVRWLLRGKDDSENGRIKKS